MKGNKKNSPRLRKTEIRQINYIFNKVTPKNSGATIKSYKLSLVA
jgi:hypothetical protein